MCASAFLPLSLLSFSLALQTPCVAGGRIARPLEPAEDAEAAEVDPAVLQEVRVADDRLDVRLAVTYIYIYIYIYTHIYVTHVYIYIYIIYI